MTIDETIGYFIHLITISLDRYWVFILLSALSRFNLYTKSFNEGNMNSMFVPYKNVVRMHLTIFLVAFLSVAEMSDYALYFIFVVYFLPVRDIIGLFKSPSQNKTVLDFQNNKSIH
jgi:L-asparagine transporter-like permease